MYNVVEFNKDKPVFKGLHGGGGSR